MHKEIQELIEEPQTAEETDKIDIEKEGAKVLCVGNIMKRSVVLYCIMTILLVCKTIYFQILRYAIVYCFASFACKCCASKAFFLWMHSIYFTFFKLKER